MDERERDAQGLGLLAGLLVVLGLTAYVAYRLAAGTENHVYSPGSVPPHTVHVTANGTYQLSYPGGVAALAEQGIDVRSLQCDWMTPGGAKQALPVNPYDPTTLSRNAVASFQAGVTGDIHVSCDGLGAMYVEDADGSSGDASGWFLLLSTVTLVFGVALALSRLHVGRRPRTTHVGHVAVTRSGRELPEAFSIWSSGEDDEVERLVRIVHERAEDGEVGDTDGDDVGR